MTDKEKIISIIGNAPNVGILSFDAILKITDYLISNGMTVREKGEWVAIKVDTDDTITCTWYKCSVCGRRINTIGTPQVCAPFCHCGADMRGII